MEQNKFKTKVSQERENTANQNKWLSNFIANLLLLISGFAMSISGLIIQIHYHVGQNPGKSTVLFLDHTTWNSIHVWVSYGFLFIVVYHIQAHRKWYRNVFKRKLSPKSRPTMLLTLLMAVTTVSGFIPWFVSFFDSRSDFRSVTIEVHDKIAVIFLIIVILHTLKRLKWYANVIKNKFHCIYTMKKRSTLNFLSNNLKQIQTIKQDNPNIRR